MKISRTWIFAVALNKKAALDDSGGSASGPGKHPMMRVVLVTKPTHLEQHGDAIRAQVEQGNVNLDNLNAIKIAHDEHYRSLDRMRVALAREKVSFVELDRNLSWLEEGRFDAVVTVGGDGTLLSASHRILDATVPLIGIRSSEASVGYLCAGGEEDIDDIVRAFVRNKLRYSERARLCAEVFYARQNKKKNSVPVLNDFLFTNSNPCATTRYTLMVGDCQESQKSSGIWISTATGSTAGIAAAGGKQQSPEETRGQYYVRELYPFTTKSCQLRHDFFDPEKTVFHVENHTDSAVLALDGQREVIPLYFGDSFTVKRAKSLRLAKLTA